jgi:hypothetical protein
MINGETLKLTVQDQAVPTKNTSFESSATAPDLAPAIAMGYVDDVGAIQTVSSTAARTDDATPGLVIGNVTDTTPTLYVDGKEVASTYNATTGVLTPVDALTGSHVLTYSLTGPNKETPQSAGMSIVVDTSGPDVINISISATKNSGLKDRIDADDVFTFAVKLSEDVKVDLSNGMPSLNFGLGATNFIVLQSTATSRTAEFDGFIGDTIYFTYQVQPGDTDLDGISIDANQISLNGAVVTGKMTGVVTSTLNHAAVKPNSDYSINAIDLGYDKNGNDLGQLISGVEVEGNWYYVWDKSGNGKISSVSFFLDPGTTKRDGATWDEVRSMEGFEINGYKLSLPELGQVFKVGASDGTTVNSGSVNNPTYSGLTAIWDAFNGNFVGPTSTQGANELQYLGWGAGSFWSNTVSSNGKHATMSLTTLGGNVSESPDVPVNTLADRAFVVFKYEPVL